MKYTYALPLLQTYKVRDRKHKTVSNKVYLTNIGDTASSLINSFPDYLGAKSLKIITSAIVNAVLEHKLVVVAFGGHVIKTGCSPFIIDLMKRGIIKALACHGACAIHDIEMALWNKTSEEVGDTIKDGSFGMVQETMDFFREVFATCKLDDCGFGRAVGKVLCEIFNSRNSIFAKAYELDLPITIHAAIGTDTIHASPDLDGATLGEAALKDFRLVCNVVADLEGGVWLNIGSAVILPEVFLKAVSIARNQGFQLNNVTTVNMDMLKQYRSYQNVISRPFPNKGYEIIGHHEIMIPLLRQSILERLYIKEIECKTT